MEVFTSVFLERLYSFQKTSGRNIFWLSDVFSDEEEIWGVNIVSSCIKDKYSQLDSCVFWGHIEYKRVNDDFKITILNNPDAW